MRMRRKRMRRRSSTSVECLCSTIPPCLELHLEAVSLRLHPRHVRAVTLALRVEYLHLDQ